MVDGVVVVRSSDLREVMGGDKGGRSSLGEAMVGIGVFALTKITGVVGAIAAGGVIAARLLAATLGVDGEAAAYRIA